MEEVAGRILKTASEMLEGMERCPGMYGSRATVETMYVALLGLVSEGYGVPRSQIHESVLRATAKHTGRTNTPLSDVEMTEEEFVSGLRSIRLAVWNTWDSKAKL